MRRSHPFALHTAILAAATFTFVPLAHAEFWIGTATTGNWSVGSNWSATQGGATNNTVPPNNDTVDFILSDSINRAIAFDYNPGTQPTYTSIELNQTGTGALGLTANLIDSFSTGTLILGATGHGNFTMTGNTNTVRTLLDIGQSAGASGIFNIGGGTLSAGGATIDVGLSGNGTFNHNAGNVSANLLRIGLGTGSVGVYTLGNQFATLTVNSLEIIGGGGNGTFNQNNANNSTGGLDLESNGTYNLSGGTLNSGINANSSDTLIGDEGAATFNQTGGIHTVGLDSSGHTLYIGSEGGNGTYLLKAGTLSVNGNIAVGNFITASPSTGLLSITGGGATVSGNVTISANGTVSMTSGSLSAANITNNGNFTQTGGTLGNGTTVFTNFANFSAVNTTGLFLGQFINYGTFNADDTYIIGDGYINFTTLTISSGHSFTVNGNPLDNEQQFDMFGGTLNVGSGLLNNAVSFLAGTIAGAGGVTNNGQITLEGTLNLNNNGVSVNNGNFLIGTGNILHLGNSAFTNNATLTLSGGFISGSSVFINNTPGTLIGSGLISALFQNSGTVFIDTGTLNIVSAFTNNGVIQLAAATAILTGGNITNNVTIQGTGSIGSNIVNNGEIAPIAGTLTLNGALANPGLLSIDVNSKLIARNLPANAGVIDLTGGTFDTANQPLINNNQITGYGTINTAGLTNNGSINLTGGTTTINGNVTNSAGHEIQVLFNPAIFTGAFVNNGIFKSTKTTVTFTGSFTENGTFFSDPAAQTFADVSITPKGVWLGSTGDQFILTGNFISHSTANTSWNTDTAQLEFTGGTLHTMSINGIDLHSPIAGFSNNFSWGILTLAPGDRLLLENDSGASVAALYLYELDLPQGLAQLSSLSGPADVKIYYDPNNPADAYLDSATYSLAGGATIAPVPEPASLLLLALAAPALIRRRK